MLLRRHDTTLLETAEVAFLSLRVDLLTCIVVNSGYKWARFIFRVDRLRRVSLTFFNLLKFDNNRE